MLSLTSSLFTQEVVYFFCLSRTLLHRSELLDQLEPSAKFHSQVEPGEDHLELVNFFHDSWINLSTEQQQRRMTPGFYRCQILLLESAPFEDQKNVSLDSGATFLHPCDYCYQHQPHRLLLIFWYIKEFVYKDTINIFLHTIIK